MLARAAFRAMRRAADRSGDAANRSKGGASGCGELGFEFGAARARKADARTVGEHELAIPAEERVNLAHAVEVDDGGAMNAEEARRLNTGAHQDRLADALAAGIRNYLEANAPPGTLIAARQGGTVTPGPDGHVRYTIARGDTLSGIASRYGISMSRIRAANGLRDDVVRIGQTLVIPPG